MIKINNNKKKEYFDILIVGSGLSGMLLSLLLSKIYNKILLISKSSLLNSNSIMAQGGISCVFKEDDSFDNHIKDTMKAGRYINNHYVVDKIIKNSKYYIEKFINDFDINFTKIYDASDDLNKNYFHLGVEGGHSHNRILHCDDETGKSIIKKLASKCLETNNITIYEYHTAVDLLIDQNKSCYGALVFDNINYEFKYIFAKSIVLATGGIGELYSKTSNSNISCGDGIAMAYRIGAKIINMEFTQFHPTLIALNDFNIRSFLISEALRGEGAKLKILHNNEYIEFMHKYHKMLELAPRDVVSIAIYKELSLKKQNNVYLDIRHKNCSFLKKRFPGIYKKCIQYNIDICKDLIPVTPAMHYSCGGVKSNLIGSTDINNLYVIGESCCNEFHGANRLASNSLLEAIVVPYFLSEYLKDINLKIKYYDLNINFKEYYDDYYTIVQNENKILKDFIDTSINSIKNIMWNYVGILRNNKGLSNAHHCLHEINNNFLIYNKLFNLRLLKLKNMITVANIIINSAINRKENKGSHYNEDCIKDKI